MVVFCRNDNWIYRNRAAAASSDEIALLNFGTASLGDLAVYNSTTGITTLTITSSTSSVALSFVGDYLTGQFKLVSDGPNNVDVFDPPVAGSSDVSSTTVATGILSTEAHTVHSVVAANLSPVGSAPDAFAGGAAMDDSSTATAATGTSAAYVLNFGANQINLSPTDTASDRLDRASCAKRRGISDRFARRDWRQQQRRHAHHGSAGVRLDRERHSGRLGHEIRRR